MAGKPVVLFNRQDAGGGFWDPLHQLLQPWVNPGDLTIVSEHEQLVPETLAAMERGAGLRNSLQQSAA